MTFKEALLTIAAVLAQAQQQLSQLQTNVLRGIWNEQSYLQIARKLGYQESYIQDVGSEVC